MITVKENTTLIGVSELRTNFKKVMELIGTSMVLLEKRNKPLAILVPVEKYNKMEELLDQIEDFGLGYLALERDSKSKPSDYIDLDKIDKK